MSCNCKNDSSVINNNESQNTYKLGKILVNLSIFIVSLITVPFILILIVWLLFKTIVLNKSINIKGLASTLIKTINNKKTEDDLDEYDFENLTEDDVILMESVDITNK